MLFGLFRRNRNVSPSAEKSKSADPQTICHDIRNALLGLQLERKRALRAASELSSAVVNQRTHLERIEGALVKLARREACDN